MNYHFDWSIISDNLGLFAHGALITIVVTLISIGTSVIVGLVMAMLRMSRLRLLRYSATAYIEFFRTIPFLVQLFWVYYVVPAILPVHLPSIVAGVLALTADVGAFTAEIFRSGIGSVDKGQSDAAKAVGLSHMDVMRHVILPQAARRVLPPLGSVWVIMFQDTALLSLVQLHELLFEASVLQANSYRGLEVLSFAGLVYLIIGYPAAKLVDFAYRRLRVKHT